MSVTLSTALKNAQTVLNDRTKYCLTSNFEVSIDLSHIATIDQLKAKMATFQKIDGKASKTRLMAVLNLLYPQKKEDKKKEAAPGEKFDPKKAAAMCKASIAATAPSAGLKPENEKPASSASASKPLSATDAAFVSFFNSIDLIPKFPKSRILKSLQKAKSQKRAESPITPQDLKVIEIFYIHKLPALRNYQGPNGERHYEFRAGYEFKHEGKTYFLPRTIEITNNWKKQGTTAWLVLNRLGKHQEGIKEELDALIGQGAYKVAKFAINLDTGALVTRLTMLDTERHRQEIANLMSFNGKLGILPIYGCLYFASKYPAKDKSIVRKIAIFTPYCAGGDLGSFIKSGRLHDPSDPERVTKVYNLIGTALEGLRTIHSEAFVHRDVKPQNFLVGIDKNGNWVCYLSDLGFSKGFGLDSAFRGTAKYAAPEIIIALDKLIGMGGVICVPPHDMWAFGLILYRIAFRKQPGNGYREAAKADLQSMYDFLKTKYLEWKAGKRVSLIDEVIPKGSSLDDLAKSNRVLFLAYQCLQIDPISRWTVQQCLDFWQKSRPSTLVSITKDEGKKS